MSGVTAERVLAVLAQHPPLMWQVLTQARMLGPWEAIGLGGGDSMCRWDPWRPKRCTLRFVQRDGQDVWRLLYEDEEPVEVVVGGPGTNPLTVLARADETLREAGYVLIDEVG